MLSKKKIKIPFRESRLTHCLADCFLNPEASRMVVVATVSPCARDAVHTRNSLNHAVDMKPYSGTKNVYIQDCVLNLPLSTAAGSDAEERINNKRMEEWSEDDVFEWLGYAAGGRFSNLTLPERKKDGKGLISLLETADEMKRSGIEGESVLAAIFETEVMRASRLNEEGASWNIMGPEGINKLEKLLLAAIRRSRRKAEEGAVGA